MANKVTRNILISLIFVVIALLIFNFQFNTQTPSTLQSTTAPNTITATINNHKFTLETAFTDTTRYKGLSDRTEIHPNGGMIFVFPDSAVRSFCMRRCLVPLDILFLDENGIIVQTHKMTVEPYDTPEQKLKSYSSGQPAMFAIELRDGSIDKFVIKTGQIVDIPLDSLKPLAR